MAVRNSSTEKYFKQIKALIAQDKLEQAIQILKKLLANSPKLNEVILQSGRFANLKKLIRTGQINYEDANITQNQIRSSLLELVDEIDHQTKEPQINKEIEVFIKSKAGKNIIGGSIIAGGNVNIGDQINTESKTSRYIRLFLFVLVPLLVISTVVIYYRYQQMIQPFDITVKINKTACQNHLPLPELFEISMNLDCQYNPYSEKIIGRDRISFRDIPPYCTESIAGFEIYVEGEPYTFIQPKNHIIKPDAIIELVIKLEHIDTIRGKVVESSSIRPIENALVSIQQEEAITNKDGIFVLPIPCDKQAVFQNIIISKEQYKTVNYRLSTISGDYLDFALTPLKQ